MDVHTERQRDRERQRQRNRATERQRETGRETETERQRDKEQRVGIPSGCAISGDVSKAVSSSIPWLLRSKSLSQVNAR